MACKAKYFGVIDTIIQDGRLSEYMKGNMGSVTEALASLPPQLQSLGGPLTAAMQNPDLMGSLARGNTDALGGFGGLFTSLLPGFTGGGSAGAGSGAGAGAGAGSAGAGAGGPGSGV
jgi:hypothetical protein